MTRTHDTLAQVVIVTPGGAVGGGGMGSVARLIAQKARSLGIRATIVDPRGDGSFFRSFIMTPIAVVRFLLSVRGCVHGTVAHLQVSERSSFPRKGVFLLLCKLTGCPVVLHHHGAEFVRFSGHARGFLRRVVRWMVTSADMNVVLGGSWRRALLELGVDEKRIAIVYNGVDDATTSPRRARRTQSQPFRVLTLANLGPRKGISELLRAMSILSQSGAHLSATVAGGGDVERYRSEAADLEIASLCRFPGWVNRATVGAYISEADAFVLPSYDEGLPMSILEALAAAVPVVATPVGAIPEILTDGQDCILVPPGNVEALQSALAALIGDPDMANRLGMAGRALYEARLDADRMMDGLLAVWQRARDRH